MSPKVVFEDDHVLVLGKPAGMVVTPAETQKEETLIDWLRENYDSSEYHSKEAQDRMGVVHRLDKETSGLLIIGKTDQAFANLQKQFKERKVKKEYIALVHGHVMEAGRVEGGIGRNPRNREKFAVLLEGKEAVTEYEPLKRLQFTGDRLQEIFSDFNKIQMRKLSTIHYNLFTLLSCHPLTGRTHQIRVHLKYVGHPIVADEKYVGRKMYRLDKRWCPRMFLHAEKLGFYHPDGGKWMEVESKLPEDLREVLNKLTSELAN
ncbi:RluA family pseudouridine synthase [Candidatus Daviesbacteria bacterium]|nr:RluA family pseudouridine synthase [Candidatus Daviesbacteria bacterium]